MAQKTIFELDLVRIAKWHRWSSIAVVTMILVWVVAVLLSINNINLPIISTGLMIFYGLTVLVSTVLVTGTQRAMGHNLLMSLVWGFASILFFFLILLSTASTAGMILRLAGAKTGTFGVNSDNLDKIRSNHCRGCGYSRDGLEILQECPECRRVPQVI